MKKTISIMLIIALCLGLIWCGIQNGSVDSTTMAISAQTTVSSAPSPTPTSQSGPQISTDVTLSNYDQIQEGMTYDQIKNLFDEDGRTFSQYRSY